MRCHAIADHPVLERAETDNSIVTSEHMDSVYVFMWPGWREELESNRWHWGKRWARKFPVVFIQPELTHGEPAVSSPESRLGNAEILSIETYPAEAESLFGVGLRQSAQIVEHMRSRGHERPLFWLYNPWLAVPYLVVPAAARVYHGTENYFDFGNIPRSWMALARYSIETSDLVVCCSNGVARGFAAHTVRKDFLTIPNGCEYLKYSRPTSPRGTWPALIADWQQSNRRLAVFAGNINVRLDYGLLTTLAARRPEIGFVLAGPISLERLSPHQRRVCGALLRRSNVRALGRLQPEDLPILYWGCDVGIIPYRTDMPILVENGFPLKALEMAAAGLPVVSSLMKPLQEVPEAVTVVNSPEAFSLAVASHSRRVRPAAAREAAERVCRAFDYDLLFERMLSALAPRFGDGPPRPGDLADFSASIGLGAYRTSIGSLGEIGVAQNGIPPRYRVGLLSSIIPLSIRRLVPVPIRRFSRRWIA